MAAALIAIVAMPILWASLMLLLALPGGLFLMALFDLLHDWGAGDPRDALRDGVLGHGFPGCIPGIHPTHHRQQQGLSCV